VSADDAVHPAGAWLADAKVGEQAQRVVFLERPERHDPDDAAELRRGQPRGQRRLASGEDQAG
jgi:hypothetical protein